MIFVTVSQNRFPPRSIKVTTQRPFNLKQGKIYTTDTPGSAA